MGRELANKFIAQKCTDIIDFAALTYIMFLIECMHIFTYFIIFLGENLPTIEQHINNQKDIVFKEIYAYCISKFGTEQGSVKFCNLFNRLCDIMVK